MNRELVLVPPVDELIRIDQALDAAYRDKDWQHLGQLIERRSVLIRFRRDKEFGLAVKVE